MNAEEQAAELEAAKQRRDKLRERWQELERAGLYFPAKQAYEEFLTALRHVQELKKPDHWQGELGI